MRQLLYLLIGGPCCRFNYLFVEFWPGPPTISLAHLLDAYTFAKNTVTRMLFRYLIMCLINAVVLCAMLLTVTEELIISFI